MVRPFNPDVLPKNPQHHRRKHDVPVPLPLPLADVDLTSFRIHVLDSQAGRLTHPEARRIEDESDGSVHRFFQGTQEPFRLRFGKDYR